MGNESTGTRLKVGVCGAAGRMGREVVKTILAQPDMTLVFAVDHHALGEDAGTLAGAPQPANVPLTHSLADALAQTAPDVVVEFTGPASVFENARQILASGSRCVIGATGLSSEQLAALEVNAEGMQTAVLVIPNFAIGAVLMMRFAQLASRFFDHAEIIELHHNQKLDAPSGTALKTAELMTAEAKRFGADNIAEHPETLKGARGGVTDANIHIHSVRLPGLVAHQEVLFGAPGQMLTLRHDSFDRVSFMPGVALAIRESMHRTGLVHGLENLLDLH